MLLSLIAQLLVLLGGTKDQCSLRTSKKMMAFPRPYTILVEGNVGSGKSTFVDILTRDDPRIAPVPEPVEAWQNVSGTGVNMLDLMFQNGPRWAGTFQLVSTLSRLNVATHLDPAKPVRVMERSIYSERYCFLENQHRTGQISGPEFAVMDRYFSFVRDNFHEQVKPDILVYLRCDLETLESHIKKRGRPEEANISAEFLQGVQRYHEDWLFYGNSSFPQPSRVVVVNASLPLSEFTALVKKLKDVIIPRHVLPPL